MTKEEAISKAKELNGKDLAIFIDYLLRENNQEIINDKDVLMAIAERLNNFGYQYHMIGKKFKEIGLNMNDELSKREHEKTFEYLEANPELIDTLEIVANWWISVIKEPYYANYDNKQISLDMAVYFQLDSREQKIRKDNNKAITPEKEEKFKKTLIYEVANTIRKNGFCELKADNYAFDILARALEEAKLRVAFPKKANMQITINQIKLVSSRGTWDIVYESSDNENKSSRKK